MKKGKNEWLNIDKSKPKEGVIYEVEYTIARSMYRASALFFKNVFHFLYEGDNQYIKSCYIKNISRFKKKEYTSVPEEMEDSLKVAEIMIQNSSDKEQTISEVYKIITKSSLKKSELKAQQYFDKLSKNYVGLINFEVEEFIKNAYIAGYKENL